MKRLSPVLALLLSLLSASIFAEEPKVDNAKMVSVRLIFDPSAKPRKGDKSRGSWSMLKKGGPAGPDVYFMQAFMGVGDGFPVGEEGGPTLFEVKVVKGDDEHLELEIPLKAEKLAIVLRRDKRVEQEVNGKKYGFLFPTREVGGMPGDKPATPNAMIIITREK